MKSVLLVKNNHNVKVGDVCNNVEPNIFEDSLFVAENGTPVGFYIKNLNKEFKNLANLANQELLSDRVPKSHMHRNSPIVLEDGTKAWKVIRQFSTILGGVLKKPHMRRNYHTISSVHSEKKAQNFIKAMYLLGLQCGDIIKKIIPETYAFQKQAIQESTPEIFRFTELFTSSISNCNISAPFHLDKANIKGCVNAIITKRLNTRGGNLVVPDYNLCFESPDNSLIVYPAWANVHGVTPIEKSKENGYRNSLIFYPLDGFNK